MSFCSPHQVYDDKKNIAATAFDKNIRQELIRALWNTCKMSKSSLW